MSTKILIPFSTLKHIDYQSEIFSAHHKTLPLVKQSSSKTTDNIIRRLLYTDNLSNFSYIRGFWHAQPFICFEAYCKEMVCLIFFYTLTANDISFFTSVVKHCILLFQHLSLGKDFSLCTSIFFNRFFRHYKREIMTLCYEWHISDNFQLPQKGSNMKKYVNIFRIENSKILT